jgi:hypothetical protein
MKTNEPTNSSKPGAINYKNPLGILIALAFFCGYPPLEGEKVLTSADPKRAKECSSKESDAK